MHRHVPLRGPVFILLGVVVTSLLNCSAADGKNLQPSCRLSTKELSDVHVGGVAGGLMMTMMMMMMMMMSVCLILGDVWLLI